MRQLTDTVRRVYHKQNLFIVRRANNMFKKCIYSLMVSLMGLLPLGWGNRIFAQGENYLFADKFIDLENPLFFLDPAAKDVSLTLAGTLGINTATPSAALHIGSGQLVGFIPNGIQVHSIYDSSSTAGDRLANLFATKQNAGTPNSIQTLEAYNYTGNPLGTTINLALTSIANLEHAGSGTIHDARGVDGSVFLTGTGTIDKAYGLLSDVYLLPGSSGNITTGFAGYFDINDQGSGAITNGYGVYIDDIDATSDYGIYQSGTTDDNYFAGNVGIGTNKPQSLLEVGPDGYLQVSKTASGSPTKEDCNSDSEIGRIILDRKYYRLFVCSGALRGWDFVKLSN